MAKGWPGGMGQGVLPIGNSQWGEVKTFQHGNQPEMITGGRCNLILAGWLAAVQNIYSWLGASTNRGIVPFRPLVISYVQGLTYNIVLIFNQQPK